jgi:hypothetical protein
MGVAAGADPVSLLTAAFHHPAEGSAGGATGKEAGGGGARSAAGTGAGAGGGNGVGAAAGTATGMVASGGNRSSGTGTAAGGGAVGVVFFLKKLNIGRSVESGLVGPRKNCRYNRGLLAL